jgi:PEGA domain
MRRYLSVIGALLALGLAGSASAAPDVGVAVLGLEPVEVPESLAQQVTDALRQRAAATGGVKVVQGKDLIEIKMIFNCDGEAPACMAQAGKSLGADKLLYGVVKKGPKATFLLALKLLDVKSGTVEKFINDSAGKRELSAGQVNVVASKWFAQLIEVDTKPTLTVTSDPSGATVTVDGTGYGKTPLTLRELTPGAHTVVLSLPGRQSATRNVELRAGGSHDVTAQLEAEAPAIATRPIEPPPPEPAPLLTALPPPAPAPHGHPGRPAKIAAAALVGGALVTAAVAIYTWRTYVDYEGKAHSDLGTNPTASDVAGTKFINNPSCDVPSSVTIANPGKFKSDCNTGKNFANATTGLWIATGALAASGVVSFIVGDRQAAHAKEQHTAAIIRQTLRVSPVFSTQGGGVSAAFEF